LKAAIAKVFREWANKLDTPVTEPTPKPPVDDSDETWVVTGPAVALSREAEAMLAAARTTPAAKPVATEGPAEGSAWYRYLMASARRENGS
jgi:hypothetical protein